MSESDEIPQQVEDTSSHETSHSVPVNVEHSHAPVKQENTRGLLKKLRSIRIALNRETDVPEWQKHPLPEIESIEFPEDHPFAPYNILAALPPEGRKFMVEMLKFAADELNKGGYSPDNPDHSEIYDRNVSLIADEAAKYIDPSFPSKLIDGESYDTSAYDEDSTATQYRNRIYELIRPKTGSQVQLALRVIAPRTDYTRPSVHGLGPFDGSPSYEPKINRINMARL
jgi:hypothetical protein